MMPSALLWDILWLNLLLGGRHHEADGWVQPGWRYHQKGVMGGGGAGGSDLSSLGPEKNVIVMTEI